MSEYDRIKGPGISIPPRGEDTEVLLLSGDGAEFRNLDMGSISSFTGALGKAVMFRYIWVDGVKFITVRPRDASPGKWKRRSYFTYGNDLRNGTLVYGPMFIVGFGGEDTLRGLTEFEKDLLWNHLLYLSVNYGTKEEPDIELVVRLCGAEDHPTENTTVAVEGFMKDVVPDGEAVLGPV